MAKSGVVSVSLVVWVLVQIIYTAQQAVVTEALKVTVVGELQYACIFLSCFNILHSVE